MEKMYRKDYFHNNFLEFLWDGINQASKKKQCELKVCF